MGLALGQSCVLGRVSGSPLNPISSVLMLVRGGIAWCSVREDSDKSTEKL